jgi:Mlc titration factor MtfA (ptsG expression regulator)
MTGLLRKFSRRRLARRPFPEEWLEVLEQRVPFYGRLPGKARERFLTYLKIFAWEKVFIGAAGMEITDEVRVVISACAVRLVVNLDLSYYDRLTEIVVYPYVYKHRDDDLAYLGEARNWGTVVLSWPAVLEGISLPWDGHETAIHEFAHVLDRADGVFDGTPPLKTSAHYKPWADVLSRHYLALRDEKDLEKKVLRMYGAINEAEFFAVATEAYFERPQAMKRLMPDLYAVLREFYGGDPADEVGRDPATL